MRKSVFIPLLVGLCALATTVMANPYAYDVALSDTAFVYGTTTQIDVSFTLYEPAEQVKVEIIGPSPATDVVRTITAGPLAAGANSIAWDGNNDFAVACPNGTYSVRVVAENLVGYASWTNLTPKPFLISEVWTTPTTEWGVAAAGNTMRGVGFDGTNIIVSGTTPRQVSILDADGNYLHNLSLTITELFDVTGDGLTTATWSLDAWLGPYDIASVGSQIYMGAYRGAGFPVALLDDLSAGASPKALAPGANARALDAVAGGIGNIVYANLGATAGVANDVLIFETDNATTYSIIETVSGVFVNSHMICAKDGNTGGDGDVVWSSTNTGTTHKYVRSGGAWAEDSAFQANTPYWCVGADYFVASGREFLALNVISAVTSGENGVMVVDANTGEQVALLESGLTAVSNDGNGDVVVDAANSVMYVAYSQASVLAKISFGYGEIGSAQYYAPTGVEVIKDPASPFFGKIAVANAYPLPSSNPMASADQQGVYMLNQDLSFYGGTEAAAYAAAQNNPAAPWSPTDSFSPWKMHTGKDEKGVLYLGDWGTLGLTDAVYRFDLASEATPILNVGTSNHGRVIAATTFTSGTKQLCGIHRDTYTLTYNFPIIGWDVDTVTSGFLGSSYMMVDANVSGLGFGDGYSYRDLVIDSNDICYVPNRRSSATQTNMFAFNVKTQTLVWSKTAADVGWAASTYPSGVALDEEIGILYVLCDGTTTIEALNMADGSVATALGNVDYGVGGRAIATDVAGNVITTSNSDEHVRLWSPPGASSRAVDAADTITMSASPGVLKVPDWMLF